MLIIIKLLENKKKTEANDMVYEITFLITHRIESKYKSAATTKITNIESIYYTKQMFKNQPVDVNKYRTQPILQRILLLDQS